MVQIVRGGPSRSQMLSELLAPALGESLSTLGTAYFANKALDKTLSDKSLDDKPYEERASMLERALAPYGKIGERLFERRMQVEQAAEQKQQQKLQAKQAKEAELLKHQRALELQKLKNEGRAAPGGRSAQPVPKEIAQNISVILNANKNATADELTEQFDLAGVPRSESNAYIESRRRVDEQSAKIPQLKTELGLKRDAELLSTADSIRNLLPTEEASLNAMEDAVELGNQSFFSMDNLADTTGLEWFRTARGGQFKTGAKTFLINNVTKFGARPNQYIEQQVADALAKTGRSKEANLASLALTRFDSEVKKKYVQILDELEESGDYEPGGLGRRATKLMQPVIEQMQTELSNKLNELSKSPSDKLSGIMLDVIGPNGEEYEIDQSEVNKLPKGYRLK